MTKTLDQHLNVYADFTLALIGISLSLTYIVLFLMRHRFHKSPGDIYLGMSIAEGLIAMHQLISSIYDIIGVAQSPIVCNMNGILASVSEILLYSYSIQLYVHMIVRLQFSLQSKKIRKWQGHLYSWIIAIVICIDQIVLKLMDSDFYSICGTIVTDFFPFSFISYIMFYALIAISTTIYLKLQINQDSQIQVAAKKFIGFITFYMVVQLSIAILLYINLIIIGLSLKQKQKNGQSDISVRVINACSWLEQFLMTATPIILPLCRLKDQFLVKRILSKPKGTKNIFSDGQQLHEQNEEFSRNDQKPKLESETEPIGQHEKQTVVDCNSLISAKTQKLSSIYSQLEYLMQTEKTKQTEEDTIIPQNSNKDDSQSYIQRRRSSSFTEQGQFIKGGKTKILKQQRKNSNDTNKQVQFEQNPFMHVLSSHVRSLVMRRILCFLHLQEFDKNQEQGNFFKKIERQGQKQSFEDQTIYIQNEQQMKQMFQRVYEEDERNYSNYKFFNVISYAQTIFDILIKNDIEQIDILQSLDLIKNEECIKQCSQTSGGKSGEFFFFNHDNRLMLKTISEPEKKIFLSLLESYFWHITNNPSSFIAKILGVFTFEGFETGSISLILMKNIQKCPKDNILRVYDIKGSTYDREVLKKKLSSNIQQNLPSISDLSLIKNTMVLKDIDFKNLEGKIKISKENADQIFTQLQEDSNFLKQQGLMDYSLIIFKIFTSDDNNPHSSLESQENSEFLLSAKDIQPCSKQLHCIQHCYQCIYDQDIYYHIGIIDYLQKYNAQKVLEKYAKKMMKFNIKLDTSSQDPKSYQMRFMKFIESLIYLD